MCVGGGGGGRERESGMSACVPRACLRACVPACVPTLAIVDVSNLTGRPQQTTGSICTPKFMIP